MNDDKTLHDVYQQLGEIQGTLKELAKQHVRLDRIEQDIRNVEKVMAKHAVIIIIISTIAASLVSSVIGYAVKAFFL